MDYREMSNEELIEECRRASNGDWMSGLKAELRRRLECAETMVCDAPAGSSELAAQLSIARASGKEPVFPCLNSSKTS
jgi:hypothetical protein